MAARLYARVVASAATLVVFAAVTGAGTKWW
jgi:hypothetical protein